MGKVIPFPAARQALATTTTSSPAMVRLLRRSAIVGLPALLPVMACAYAMAGNTGSLMQALHLTLWSQVILFALVTGIETALARLRGRSPDLPLGWRRGLLGFAAFTFAWAGFVLLSGLTSPGMLDPDFLRLLAQDMARPLVLLLAVHVFLSAAIHLMVDRLA